MAVFVFHSSPSALRLLQFVLDFGFWKLRQHYNNTLSMLVTPRVTLWRLIRILFNIYFNRAKLLLWLLF